MKIALQTTNDYLAYSLRKMLRVDVHLVDRYLQDIINSKYLNDYQIIIIDRSVADIELLKLCTRLRRYKASYIIITLTDRVNKIERLDGFLMGVDFMQTKPLKPKLILAIIKSISRRLELQIPDNIYYKETEVNIGLGLIRNAQRIMKLSTIELKILKLLIRNRGQITSYNELYYYIWNGKLTKTANILNVYLNKLRKKFRDFSLNEVIITVGGYGYKLKPYT